MVASLGVPASNPIIFPSSRPLTINSMMCGRVSCGFQVIARDPLKKTRQNKLMPLLPLMKIIKIFPYWGLVLSNIATLSAAAEQIWTNLSWNMGQLDMISDRYESCKLKKGGRIFQQNFAIRSYEIGSNGMASLESILNHLQDSTLNHLRNVGLAVDGGSSLEMNRRNLTLVVCKLQIAVDCYPSSGDFIQVSTWLSAHGKNGFGRYFHITDRKTGKTLIRMNSLLVMMNKQTRKLSKCDQEIKLEFEPYLMDCDPIISIDRKKLPELDDTTADYVRGGLILELKDLDFNQHVNNSKYIGLILESTPFSILETHELSAFTLEYRKECKRDSVLQSLTALSTDESSSFVNTGKVEFNHLLRLENGDPIVKGRTSWRLKSSQNLKNVDQILE